MLGLIDENDDGQVCQNEFRTFVCGISGIDCIADQELDGDDDDGDDGDDA